LFSQIYYRVLENTLFPLIILKMTCSSYYKKLGEYNPIAGNEIGFKWSMFFDSLFSKYGR
jgi:hypothetical protein